MRDAFVDELTRLALNDSRVAILSADIGNRMFDKFKAGCPGRFHNVGIAEAAMAGMAAGLAIGGLRPFAYTIAAFNPGRCAEQIRLDICQHNLPVVVAGTGAGLSYASLGPTHHALEDIAWMRALPNITILCPGDPLEVRAAVKAALRRNGPVYLRLGKKGEPNIHTAEPELRIGRVLKIRDGGDAALLAVGTVLPEAAKAADLLSKKGIMAAVYSFHTAKPLDEELLETLFDSARGVSAVAVIEEHVAAGGVWSAIAEWLAERGGQHAPLLRFGTSDAFFHEAGGQAWARKRMGMNAESIADRVAERLRKGRT